MPLMKMTVAENHTLWMRHLQNKQISGDGKLVSGSQKLPEEGGREGKGPPLAKGLHSVCVWGGSGCRHDLYLGSDCGVTTLQGTKTTDLYLMKQVNFILRELLLTRAVETEKMEKGQMGCQISATLHS